MTTIPHKLSPEEQRYEDAIEAGHYSPIPDLEQRKKQFQDAVLASKQRKKISLRIPQGDLERIKHKAQELGMPYQTLINSVLHQYATNKLQ